MVTNLAGTSPNVSLTGRAGYASVWGSNGPFPVHVCLNGEMGLTYGAYYSFTLGYLSELPFGAVAGSADLTQLNFRGEGNALGTPGFLSGTPTYPIEKGDALSGDMVSTITAVNADINADILTKTSLRLVPRLQFVDYIKNTSLKNSTRNWALDEKINYKMFGLGGSIEWVPWGSNSRLETRRGVSPRVKGTVITGGSRDGSRYLFWDASIHITRWSSEFSDFMTSRTEAPFAPFRLATGVSMWKLVERALEIAPGFTHDEGSVSSLIFYGELEVFF